MEEELTKNIHTKTQLSLNFSHGNDAKNDAPNVLLPYDISIPLDVTREILMRLPAKSVVRFRCVSKQWLSITTQQDFIKSFATRSSARPRLLLSFAKGDKILFFSLPQHEIPDEKCLFDDHVSNYHINLPENDKYMCIFESVNGLISFSHRFGHIIIWNPSIRQHVTIPKPENLSHGTSYLGYDPIGGTYKLVCTPYIYGFEFDKGHDRTQVLTLGVDESWRMIKESPTPMYAFQCTNCKCIDGVLYYLVLIPEIIKKSIIMSFDVRYEKFKPIQLPCCTRYMNAYQSLLSYDGRLALVCLIRHSIKPYIRVRLWILENVVEEKWSCKDLQLPFPIMDSPLRNLDHIASDVTVNGDQFIIYVATSRYDDDNLHVIYYDLKKNSVTPFKIERIEDDEFKLHDENTYAGIFWVFTGCSSSSHTESLVSLKNITCSSMACI